MKNFGCGQKKSFPQPDPNHLVRSPHGLSRHFGAKWTWKKIFFFRLSLGGPIGVFGLCTMQKSPFLSHPKPPKKPDPGPQKIRNQSVPKHVIGRFGGVIGPSLDIFGPRNFLKFSLFGWPKIFFLRVRRPRPRRPPDQFLAKTTSI